MWRRPAAVCATAALLHVACTRRQTGWAKSVLPTVPATDLQDLLAAVTRDAHYADRGFFAANEEAKVAPVDQVWAQYGYIEFDSVQAVLARLHITAQDVFYDLGSGIGNVCAQAFLNSPAREVKGVEFVPSRHTIALELEKTLKARYPDYFAGGRALHFECGNLLDHRFPDATVIFVCSWCFDEPLLEHIGRCASRCSGLRFLVSLRPLPASCSLPLEGTLPVNCDFSPDPLPAYIYAGPAAPPPKD